MSSTSKITLDYPIYAADFHSENNDFLFVGGGGGEGRSGVSNKITFLDVSRRQTIQEVSEIKLSSDEDSVSSLAVIHENDSTATILAGINASQASQKSSNRNEHLRSFTVNLPGKRKREEKNNSSTGPPTALDQTQLFVDAIGPKRETYQRVLRLAPTTKKTDTRFGIAATGLASTGEVAIFTYKNGRVGTGVGHLTLSDGEEAADIDLFTTTAGVTALYITDNELRLVAAEAHTTSEVNSASHIVLYKTSPSPPGKPAPKLRFARFLSEKLVVLVLNQPQRSGVKVVLLEIRDPSASKLQLRHLIVQQKALHRGVSAATAFSISRIPQSDEPLKQKVQYVVAIAGHDRTITMLTLEHDLAKPNSRQKIFLQTHGLHKDVHPSQISSLAFSTLRPPQSTDNDLQLLKLASTGIANTVVVQSFPLIEHPATDGNGKAYNRYVLAKSDRAPGARGTVASILSSIVVIGLLSLLIQLFGELRGLIPEKIGARQRLPKAFVDLVAPAPPLASTSALSSRAAVALNEVPSGVNDVVESIVLSSASSGIADVSSYISSATSALPSVDIGKKLRKPSGAIRTAAADISHKLSKLTGEAGHIRTMLEQRYAALQEAREEHDPSQPHKYKALMLEHEDISHQHDEDDDEDEDDNPAKLQDKVTKKQPTLKGSVKSGAHAVEHGVRFEDLPHHERENWKKKLSDAGVWSAAEGEAILKGVFFGGLAGVVGGALH